MRSSLREIAAGSERQRAREGTWPRRLPYRAPERKPSAIDGRVIPGHPVTIPEHSPLKVGTLAANLADVAGHLKIDRDELLKRLFG